MTLDANGVVLAAIAFGVSAGMWAAFMTFSVQGMKRDMKRVNELLALLFEELVGPSAEEIEQAYAIDRDPRRVLDHYATRIRGARS